MLTDEWLASAHLVHAAFGVRRYTGDSLPLSECDLPRAFVQLPEGEQVRQEVAALTSVFAWAAECGADQLLLDVLGHERKRLNGTAFRAVDGWRYQAPFTTGNARLLFGGHPDGWFNPELLYVLAQDRVLIYVVETWDSVLVNGSDEEVAALAARVGG